MRRFHAPPTSIDSGNIMLDADETRHLRSVLRLNTGDEVSVFDGEGKEYQCMIDEIGKQTSSLRIVNEVPAAAPESSLDLTLAAAILKGEKFDLVVQKAVELGVYRLVPLQTIRGDVKPKDIDKRVTRWQRIALDATKQCGRARLMTIEPLVSLHEFVAKTEGQNVVMFSERDGDSFSTVTHANKMTCIIGPEGGWDDTEIAAARSHDVNVVTLGGRTLRAETAAISLTAVIQHRFGDLN
jgi:16S rRNA (uracil1498-N3)-methyltransferase